VKFHESFHKRKEKLIGNIGIIRDWDFKLNSQWVVFPGNFVENPALRKLPEHLSKELTFGGFQEGKLKLWDLPDSEGKKNST
jgi:hypothetical protein